LKGASRDEALAGIFGYTCGNDVSARAWQRADGQWWRAKGSDTFGAFGPAIATGLDHADIELETRVNGARVQHARSDELIRDIPEIVRYVSAAMTLVPGDVIYTGTPGEPKPLSAGDVVEVEITGAGVLRNRVIEGER
jgi:2-keto-4-pentenoate hydratase/2-oxohepta-3-ene-1,7-dioic acid hydratase in catechol pathway